MADFEPAFDRMMKEEGYVLTNDPNDKGGQTYGGVSRKFHPQWEGWRWIDAGQIPPTEMLRTFYRQKFWAPIRGDEIVSQKIAEVLFGQFVNMGGNAIKLMQHTLSLAADGVVGPKTLAALNAANEELFLAYYCIANVTRYHAIGMKDKTQRIYWPGWFGRALRIAK